MKNHDYYVSEETWELLQKAGCDWNDDMRAYTRALGFDARPSVMVAVRWLREVCNIIVWVAPIMHEGRFIYSRYAFERSILFYWEEPCVPGAKEPYFSDKAHKYGHGPNCNGWATIEEALEAGVKKCCECLIAKNWEL